MTIQPIAINLLNDCIIDGLVSPDNSELFGQILQKNITDLADIALDGESTEDQMIDQDAAACMMALLLGDFSNADFESVVITDEVPLTAIEPAAMDSYAIESTAAEITAMEPVLDSQEQPNQAVQTPEAAVTSFDTAPVEAMTPAVSSSVENTASSEALSDSLIVPQPTEAAAGSGEALEEALAERLEQIISESPDFEQPAASGAARNYEPIAVTPQIKPEQAVLQSPAVVQIVEENQIRQPEPELRPEQTQAANAIAEPEKAQAESKDSGGMDAGDSVLKSNDKPDDILKAQDTDPAVFNVETSNPSPVSFEDKSEAVNKAVNSIMDDIKSISGREANSIEIQLEPESLGKLAISLVMSESGLIAQIRSGDSDIRGILASQISGLVETLKENGIAVQSVEVLSSQVQNQDLAHENAQNPYARQETPTIRTTPEVISGYEVMDDQSYQYPTEIMHTGRIDYLA